MTMSEAAIGDRCCQCESATCEREGDHAPGACSRPAGKEKALYVGPLCDACAARTPGRYLHPLDGLSGPRDDDDDDDDGPAIRMETILADALHDYAPQKKRLRIQTFEQVGVLTENRGLVVDIDGASFEITIVEA